FICGFDTIGRGRFQTHRVRYSEHLYEAESFLELASALIGEELHFDPDQPFLEVNQRWIDWADRKLATCGSDRPAAVIVPAASSPHRFWAPQRYAEVARRLCGRGFRVVVLGGADAVTAAGIIEAACDDGQVLNLAGRTSLAQTAGIVKRARLYVSADTGALHIAYGVGTPTVHMFGSGIQVKWAPRGGKYVVVNKGLPCSPCTRYGYTPPCPYGVACMDAITVEDVMRAIDEVLD
ncbi:MAG: glycosyltransferase family 9 protein, partial [Planctomycetes bacterium]|nr:glycosyltransferase family 9 protein [Planctomycetota bacterium]